jgi:enoyl-CoA hydratase/carnithine racemase
VREKGGQMSYKTILYEKKGGFTHITFNRPEVLNSVNEEMILELDDAIGQVERDGETGALILSGAGNAFIAGGDIKMINKGLESPYEFFRIHDRLTRFNFRLERLPIPVIAAINGFAFGGGLEIAVACDFRIMSEKAKVGLPEVGLGIMPGAGATARLARLIGKQLALFMELTGSPIDAQEALRSGLVLRVVPPDRVVAAAEELAERIMQNAPASVALIKRAIQVGLDMPLEGAMEYCQYGAIVTAATKDAAEGTRAFLEKRRPVWQGK